MRPSTNGGARIRTHVLVVQGPAASLLLSQEESRVTAALSRWLWVTREHTDTTRKDCGLPGGPKVAEERVDAIWGPAVGAGVGGRGEAGALGGGAES